ncbi:Fatty-acyl reductase [Operophtera brumata]|uniref:Fatty-acyl reductase n=1 Tax=Operophtera brumata TaxID=104452 RepID=A0A0L7K5J7_OPEBR|nr:Fatty-acyl reductase [Operophtera brumata]
MVRDRLDFFTSRSWLMKTDQTRALAESLSPQDAQLFLFHPREICWKNYMNIYLHGIGTYLLGNKA